jgi:hypothetical protein
MPYTDEESNKYDASARQIWLGELEKTVAWIEEWIATRTDDELAWYTEKDAPGPQTKVTRERLDAAIAHLGRVRAITFSGAKYAARAIYCAVCGRIFSPRRTDTQTCSPACRQKAYRDRKRVTKRRHKRTAS